MKKVVAIDGNNLMFRAYFATAYSGVIMRNSKGFPTNALYGFVSMINKIIEEEKPEYIVVAFDIGKNFRKKEYSFYKEGRSATPEELKLQMPIAGKILDALGIAHIALEPYEADDIIGTIVKYAEQDPEYSTLIVSSDKDLLQLISLETEIKLLKQKGNIRYNLESFKKEFLIEPIKVIDLKALMGDASDNIPGVKGIGEKTALKLLQEYGSLDNIYQNIEEIKGKVKEKLINDKENAYISQKLATIYKEVPLDIDFEEYKYLGGNSLKLREIFEELEFFSLLKNIKDDEDKEKVNYKVIYDLKELKLDGDVAFYLEVDNQNYHFGDIIGVGISTKDNNYFIKKDLVRDAFAMLKGHKLITYDLKKSLIKVKEDIKCDFDLMIASYLLNMPSNEDISKLMNSLNEEILSYDEFKKYGFTNAPDVIIKKSNFIFQHKEEFKEKLLQEDENDILTRIEMPLVYVLANMEKNGFKFEEDKLVELQKDIRKKIDILTKEIYNLSGVMFNISSPKQVGKVLFEDLKIGKGKKLTSGSYKSDSKTLQRYSYKHPIVNKILEYRNLTKLLNTYIDSLNNYVLSDNKIHTIFNQTLTRTGRLSSMEPNLQNIPVREELGKKIRKAFVPEFDYILSADYSQIELRILAHISESEELIEAFRNDEDIHTKVAADIHGVKENEVTKEMRTMAKAVIFGIVYGISGFGLGENLQISMKTATQFIQKYYELYPGVKKYMDDIIKSAYETGEVKTMFGRTRKIFELQASDYTTRKLGERMALNTPIQGSSADIMKMAMIKVYKEMQKYNLESKMILQVHDEIIIDAKKEEIDTLKKILKDSMENIVKLRVPLKVEINLGSSWYDAK